MEHEVKMKKNIESLDSIDVNIDVIKKNCNMKSNNYRISQSNNCEYQNIHSRIKSYIYNNHY